MAQSSLLFIGIKGAVVAIDRATGQEVWRTDLKRSGFVNVVVEDGELFAAALGELFCLDAATGHIRWRNALRGLGLGLISIAGNRQSVVLRARQQEEEAAAAASTST